MQPFTNESGHSTQCCGSEMATRKIAIARLAKKAVFNAGTSKTRLNEFAIAATAIAAAPNVKIDCEDTKSDGSILFDFSM